MGSTSLAAHGTTDLELVARYKETEDLRVVGELYQRHKALILGRCTHFLKSKDDAQDASMDIFEELVAKLLVHNVANFRSWLYTLVGNHCLMKIRKVKDIKEVDVQSEKIENRFMENPDFEHLLVEGQSESELLQVAMAQLKENQRLCVDLFYLQELSYKEVAEKTGFDLNQVKSDIQNGKRNLKLILTKMTHED
jgi:RNA polymerase sigma-70 factor (ECF subfamily)